MYKILLVVIASAVAVAMLSAFGTLPALATPSPTGSGNGCINAGGTPVSAGGTCGGAPGQGGTPTGQPGSGSAASPTSGTTLCQNGGNAQMTPGNPQSSNGGGTHNPNSQASQVYAGQSGSASLAHSNSPNAVSQYDISCFQQTSNPGHTK